jgi:oligopeptide transport system substrate-binding protein
MTPRTALLSGLTRRGALTGAAALGLGALSACGRSGEDIAGLLRVAIDTEPDSLDPLKGQFASSALLYKQLHAPLTEYSPSGGLAPGLAQSWRSSDGRVWRFRLAPDLRWSDGMPLTADDVVWTAQRAVDPRTGFANLGDFFAVRGARDALAGRAPASDIGVHARDPRTIIFELVTPVGAFPVLMREFYPLPRHVIEAHGDRWVRAENWVSAGPYMLRQASALTYYLQRNPRFHAAGSVSIANIRVDVIEDEATRARLFRSGDLDLADRPPAEQIGFLQREIGNRLHAFDAPILTYLKLNHRKPGLSDARVRRALSLAVDRHFLAEQFFSGEARPTLHVIPPHVFEDEPEPVPGADPDAARALLAEAGYGPDNPLRLQFRVASGGRERVAIAIADDLRNAGLVIDILASYPHDINQAVAGADFDMTLGYFNRGLKAEPDFMLEPFAPGGFADDTGWTGPDRARFAELMEEARGLVSRSERIAVQREAERVFLEDQCNVPLLHERAFWMIHPRVRRRDAGLQPQLWRDLSVV